MLRTTLVLAAFLVAAPLLAATDAQAAAAGRQNFVEGEALLAGLDLRLDEEDLDPGLGFMDPIDRLYMVESAALLRALIGDSAEGSGLEPLRDPPSSGR